MQYAGLVMRWFEYHERIKDDSVVSPAKYLFEQNYISSHEETKYRNVQANSYCIPTSPKMYRYVKCRLRTRSNNDSIKFVQEMRKEWHITRSTLQRKSSNCGETLGGKYVSLYSCNTSSILYKLNASHTGHYATLNLCNDIETNPGPPQYTQY